MSGLVHFQLTGNRTGRYPLEETQIKNAHAIYQQHNIAAEPSSANALGLYLRDFENGLVSPKQKILIINTGNGIYDEIAA